MIRTLDKAIRAQKARHAKGKLGWSRAVRRFVAVHPEIRHKLMPYVRDAEGSRAAQRAFKKQSPAERHVEAAGAHWAHSLMEAIS